MPTCRYSVGPREEIVKPDDEICLCFHVSLRKLVHFARRERPGCPSQMSECLSAGTGCGWCIPVLERIARDPDRFELTDAPEAYAAARRAYRQAESRNKFDDAGAED